MEKIRQFLSGGWRKKVVVPVVVLAAIFLAIGLFVFELGAPTAATADFKTVEIRNGDGFRSIVSRLAEEGVIRSRLAFGTLAVLMGSATKLKPGVYAFSPMMTATEILRELLSGSHREVTVTVREGESAYDIERVLNDAGVLQNSDFLALVKKENLEGKLFPDTYRFFTDSRAEEVLTKFNENFRVKVGPLLVGKKIEADSVLILASLVQMEVPEPEDQKIVAGVLKKRLEAGMPLQVDATICYIKRVNTHPLVKSCYPLAPLDFKIDSAYNTYLHRGLPPGPIGNAGLSAIRAAVYPQSSPYWFYLSDPLTRKTVFSKTLDEHNKNRAKYLGL